MAKLTFIAVIFAIIALSGGSYIRYRVAVDRDLEKERLIQDEKTKRTQERLKYLPWNN